jgi:hypothetical protein
VQPWVLDVTAWLLPEGGVNMVEYRGRYLGGEPGTFGKPGFILMQSSLVLYVGAAPSS